MNNPDYIEEGHSDMCVVLGERDKYMENQCSTHCDMHPSTQTNQCHILALIDRFKMARDKIISSNVYSLIKCLK